LLGKKYFIFIRRRSPPSTSPAIVHQLNDLASIATATPSFTEPEKTTVAASGVVGVNDGLQQQQQQSFGGGGYGVSYMPAFQSRPVVNLHQMIADSADQLLEVFFNF
jgi:hypothetical protein